MSGHVTSRLSAFLDRELTENEASGVRQHLADCEVCAARLREMEGANRAFAEMPVEAPSGYFDSFAGRVRSRIEKASGAVAPGKAAHTPGFQLPTWAWAVAATLLLAVLLPRVTWDRGRPRTGAEREASSTLPPAVRTPALEADAPAPPASTPLATVEPSERALRPAESLVPAAGREDVTPRDSFAEARLDDKKANEAVVARRPAAAPPQPVQATPAPAPGKWALGPQAPESAKAPPALAKPQARKDREVEAQGGTSGQAAGTLVGEAHLQRRDEGASEAPPVQEEALRSADLEKREAAPAVPPDPGGAALGRTTEARRRAVAPGMSASGQDAPAAKRAEVEFEALVTRPAESLEDLRRLREAWRSFVGRHTEGPRVDEARVAFVAVSVEIAVRSRTPEDAAEARRSGKTYLDREDAAQRARVQDLLARLPQDR